MKNLGKGLFFFSFWQYGWYGSKKREREGGGGGREEKKGEKELKSLNFILMSTLCFFLYLFI